MQSLVQYVCLRYVPNYKRTINALRWHGRNLTQHACQVVLHIVRCQTLTGNAN